MLIIADFPHSFLFMLNICDIFYIKLVHLNFTQLPYLTSKMEINQKRFAKKKLFDYDYYYNVSWRHL